MSFAWRGGGLVRASWSSLHLGDVGILLLQSENCQQMILWRGGISPRGLTSHQSWPFGAERICEIKYALIYFVVLGTQSELKMSPSKMMSDFVMLNCRLFVFLKLLEIQCPSRRKLLSFYIPFPGPSSSWRIDKIHLSGVPLIIYVRTTKVTYFTLSDWMKQLWKVEKWRDVSSIVRWRESL